MGPNRRPASRARCQRSHLSAALLLAACGAAAPPEDPTFREIAVTARPVDLVPDDATLTTVGRLAWRGGLALSSVDGRFGGLSGLRVGVDGTHAIAISDRGSWLTFSLVHDDAGRLAGVSDVRMAPMLDQKGRVLTGKEVDAEALEALPDGQLVVSFEHVHRLALYDPLASHSAPPLSVLVPPTTLAGMGDNQGLEGVALLDGAQLLALAERRLNATGGHTGALVPLAAFTEPASAAMALPVRIARASPFDITDACLGPDDALYILERSFDPWRGPAMRVRRITAEERTEGTPWQGEELARLDGSYAIDNMEGISVRLNEAGETLLYLLSDDNFNPLHRTLLLLFAVSTPPASP